MKVPLVFNFILILFVLLHWTEAIRKDTKRIKLKNSQRKSVNESRTKKSLQRRVEDGKIFKVNASLGKENAMQEKRQFVPGVMPFLNFPHPHIHRIIVHHHPGRSLTQRDASANI